MTAGWDHVLWLLDQGRHGEALTPARELVQTRQARGAGGQWLPNARKALVRLAPILRDANVGPFYTPGHNSPVPFQVPGTITNPFELDTAARRNRKRYEAAYEDAVERAWEQHARWRRQGQL